MKNQTGKLLIIDDSEENLQLLASIFDNENIEYKFAMDGEKSIKILNTENFDLILLDIRMPGMDGLEVCKRIKKNQNTKQIPIVFLSAEDSNENKIKAFELGAVDFISHPFVSKELVARVKTHLKLSITEKKLKKSEEKLRNIFENSTNLFYSHNINHIIEYVSPQIKTILGYTVEEAMINWTNFASDNPINTIGYQSTNKAIETGLPQPPFEFELIKKDGGKIWVEVREAPVIKYGKTISIVGALTDITERKIKDAENKKLLLAIEQSPSVIIITNKKGNIEYANPKFTTLTGYSTSEIIGKNPRILNSGKQPDDLFQNLWETISSGKEWYGKFNNKNKNGDLFWESASISPIIDNFGKITGYIKVAEDITENITSQMKLQKSYDELEQAQEASINLMNDLNFEISEHKKVSQKLAVSEKEHRLLVENAPIGICTTDLNEKYISVNKAYCDITGYSKKELLRFQSSDITVDKNNKIIKDLIHGKIKNAQMKKQYIKKDKKIIDVIIDAFVQVNDKNEPIHLVSLLRDITHEKQLEYQLRQSQKMEAIGTLAGGIAHDFNNILQIITGYLSIAQIRAKDDIEITTYLNYIQRASDRAMNLVSQILTFSRQSGNKKEKIDLSTILTEELKLIRSSIPPHIQIKTNIDKNGIFILSNPNQIHQVIMNICTNAYHAIGDTKGSLDISLKEVDIKNDYTTLFSKIKKGRYAKLIIKDSGTGIKIEDLKRIFNPFYTTKEVGHGTGLGLSTVLGIVEDNEGGIDVASKYEEGTEFSIFFPICNEIAESCINNEKKEVTSGEGNILLIDDEKHILKLNKLGLEDAGYYVDSRNDGIEALEYFISNPKKFDLVITDQLMPEIKGIEIAKQIRKINKNVPILLYTGHFGNYDKEKIKEAGINQIVWKPTRIQKLQEIIHNIMHKKEVSNE